jgi:hypothetical protein
MRESIPGEGGLIGLGLATLAAAVAMVVLFGEWLPALACGLAVIVGMWAVDAMKAINK